MSNSKPSSVKLPSDRGDILLRYFEPRDDGVDFPASDLEGSIPERFEKITRLYPDRIAVKVGEQSLTYREFNQAANRIARQILEERGQGSEPIALLLEHGVDVLAAIFGVLKTGKFYVALDPTSPLARIEYIINDAGVRLLVTNGANHESARRLNRGDVGVVNIDEIETTTQWDESLLHVSPDDFAALMYTSGSEGLPKGLLESHRFMLHSARGMTHVKRITPRDRLTLLHFVGFAAAEAQFVSSLLNGACLCPFDIKSRGVQSLTSWLEAEGISLAHMPVSAFRQWVELIPSGTEFSQLRLVHLSGAPITRSDFDLYRAKFSAAISLQIVMGTTEAGVVASGIIDHRFGFPETGTPIGYAWPNKQLQLLDENGREVAPGETGEITVRSRYMSAGYWRVEGKVNQVKFLADPDGGEQRTYDTGDLARMTPDGFFIHMGRKDLRVKIRGYRVEIGEIETALLSHPVIQNAAVRAWERESGEKYLAGYIVTGEPAMLTVSDLLEFLRHRLPEYMIPAAFVFLESLPLTNGKIDRNALPVPGGSRPNLNHPYAGPRNSIESKILQIWEELLDIRPIGIYDDFFDLGGDSLLVSRSVARLCHVFRLEMPLAAVFDYSTAARLAECIETALSDQQIQHISPIVPMPRNINVPLSFSQQRLWFLDQLEPRSCAYNLLFAFQLTGDLNILALAEAFNAIVARHEALRTVFAESNGQPFQIILPSMKIDLSAVDLRAITSQAAREGEVRRLCASESQRPFDLSCGPLIRVTLLQLTEGRYVLCLVVHHIVFDGWSIGILTRELSVFYRQFCQGRPAPLEQLGIQYPDFAIWQRQRFGGELLAGELSYWKTKLSQSPPLLALPTDRPRPRVQSYHGAQKSFVLSGELLAGLKSLGQENGTTLFMTLLAAYQTLLQRYTGQNDIVVGSPVAGRKRKEIEGLIGFFLNMLVLRTDLSENPTFRQLLTRVREVCLEAYAHQDLPFDKIVEELSPDRDLSRNPFFQVTFALQNTPLVPLSLTGLSTDELDLDSRIAIFDLHLYMAEEQNRLCGWLIYNSDIFDDATIARTVQHFQVLLGSIVADPDRRLSELPLLTAAERYQLLVEWNDTQGDYPSDKCIHQLFEEQVERTPEAVAVVFEDQQLTYGELNRRANHLAHYLRRQHVGPEVLVGICMERSIETVVGLLGILKAGGAYVPLDPTYPAERLKFMLDDAQVSVLLTQGDLLEDGGSRIKGSDRCSALDPHIQQVRLDRDWELIARENDANPDNTAAAENLAYVIYTSGSTGEPKGVAVPHRAVNRLVMNTDYVHVTPSEVMAQASNVSFDAATFEIWGALLNGARLVLIAKDTLLSPQSLSTAIDRHGITTLFLTTALFNQMVEQIPAALGKLRHLLFGGEAVDAQRVKELLQNGPPRRLLHVYGPTETTTFATWYRVKAVAADATTVPIGRPIANTGIYILDTHLNPVPIGVSGELYIGGPGVARGYLNRPALTAETFIRHPFTNDPQARLYKTGDRARYLPDGNIEFLGRLDNQIKIRGYRIELDEIETVLAQHPGVRETVVIARGHVQGDSSTASGTGKRLVAYVVQSQGPAVTLSELRSFLKHKLPDYMIPSAFVFLKSLPLTPNGKVDRRALPTPTQSRPELKETFSAPRTPTEELLINIWADLLKLEQVGIHDDFFELGGHSLLATQLLSRVRDTFGLELPLRSLFEAPSVGGMAEQIVAACQSKAPTRALPIVPESIDAEYPLSFSQERFWFLEQLEPNNSAYKVAYGFRLTGPLDIEALEKSVSEIVRRHESLRTTFHESHGAPVQRVSEQWSFRLNVIDERAEPGADLETKVQRLFENEYRRPFDLSTDLLLRGTLLRLSDSDHVLVISSRHLAWDHWSIELFFREISVLYRAFAAAKPSPLAELPIQYRHYALWQRKMFQAAAFEQHLAYWKRQLNGAPSSLNLPLDHPRQPLINRRGGSQALVLPQELSRALSALSAKAQGTLFMTFLAAFQTLLHRMTGDDDIVVGTPVAGRDRSETESLIGLFLNSLALRTNLSGNPTFVELLTRVREVALGAYDHQELPFEKLVEALQPERDLTTTPIFQVFINMYNFKEVGLELDGLTVGSLNFRESATQFDISCSIREDNDGIHLTFLYDADLFEFSTITRMLWNFQTLLQSIISNPDQRISDLSIVTELERHQLLVEWNDTKRDYPLGKCIHQLFETQVEKTPDAIALVFEAHQLTYRELNNRANQLARYLQKLGVGADVLVGICVQRSIEMVVGLLGILKAGGAYVPLDPSYPKQRLAYTLKDSGVPVLLTLQELSLRLPEYAGQAVCLDQDWQTIGGESSENLSLECDAGNLAYAIYTSGSTGNPKGVMIPHRAICNHMMWMLEEFPLNQHDRVAQRTSLSFDASVWEVFAPLLSGAQLVLARPGGYRDAEDLVKFLQKEQITILQVTPTLLQMLLEENMARCGSLRRVFSGGEPLSPELYNRFSRQIAAPLTNLYGPTEAAIDATSYTCSKDDFSRRVPIGRPIANSQIYILDPYLAPVPIGVIGEIYIGGGGLARGYLNRPELTAEKFVYHSFSGEPARRLYRTGDRGRYLPDGNIEFLGRLDEQVKIRGYRIELGEIEAVLGQHPAVREALVTVREENPADKRLVAYFVEHEGASVEAKELRAYLKEKLPDYMVPSVFAFLDSLPLTPNGKVDRNALPEPDHKRSEPEESFVAPRTEIEGIVARIWAEVLRLDNVGIHDNFFDLGGHSLLAMQVVSRVREAFCVELPIRSLFEAPTVAGLVAQIAQLPVEAVAPEEMMDLLANLESLSDEEAQKRLSEISSSSVVKSD